MHSRIQLSLQTQTVVQIFALQAKLLTRLAMPLLLNVYAVERIVWQVDLSIMKPQACSTEMVNQPELQQSRKA